MPAIDLFSGEDPALLNFKDMVYMVNKMLEKFFIVSQDGACQMKVEIDEIPIQEYMAKKALEAK